MVKDNNLDVHKLDSSIEKFPLVLKQMTDAETIEYHLARLYRLSKKWNDLKK